MSCHQTLSFQVIGFELRAGAHCYCGSLLCVQGFVGYFQAVHFAGLEMLLFCQCFSALMVENHCIRLIHQLIP